VRIVNELMFLSLIIHTYLYIQRGRDDLGRSLFVVSHGWALTRKDKLSWLSDEIFFLTNLDKRVRLRHTKIFIKEISLISVLRVF
jgi:hypothetical protein